MYLYKFDLPHLKLSLFLTNFFSSSQSEGMREISDRCVLILAMGVHLHTLNGKAYDSNCHTFKSNKMGGLRNQSLNKLFNPQ